MERRTEDSFNFLSWWRTHRVCVRARARVGTLCFSVRRGHTHTHTHTHTHAHTDGLIKHPLGLYPSPHHHWCAFLSLRREIRRHVRAEPPTERVRGLIISVGGVRERERERERERDAVGC